MEYVWLANFTGCPAISCPAGLTGDGDKVPVGVMAMGEWGTEEDLIAFARDGVGLLDEGDRESVQSTGLKIPNGRDSFWEDIIASSEAGESK